MKQKILLFALLCCSVIWNTAKANESEPNNTRAQANTLAFNGSDNGIISPAADQDWWKVTTTGDGNLSITLTPLSGKYTWIYLYDNDGVTPVATAAYSTGAFTVTGNGLAAGTYYIKVICFYNTDTGSYTISNALTVPVQANDVEPNDTKALAKVLPLNSSKTGHVDYYYNLHRDTADWYKVTTTADGRLRLRITSNNGQNVWAYLYDNNGTTQLNAAYTTGTLDINTDGLAAGTYYVRVNTYFNYEYAPYTLADSLFSPSQPNDTEPDSTRALALTLPLNGNVTGHIDYYYNLHRDTVDWYKVTANADGRVRLTMTSGNGQNVWAYLYDNDGTTLLASGYTAGSAVVVNKDGLAAGTYYVRVNTYYSYEYAPYTLADSLFIPAQANDNEPNNSRAQALTLAQGGSTTGHVNYYYNLVKDTADWYKLTTANDGRINITITSHDGQNVWAYLYDNDGTTQLDAHYTTGTTTYGVDGLRAGTYYIRVNTYYSYEYAPYTLGNTLSTYANTNDAEPDNYFAQAKTVSANSTTTGHVNFYYNSAKDAVDIFKINYTGSGNMTLVFNQENRFNFGSAVATWFQVYKDTAAGPVYSNYHYSTSGNINLTGLTQGYYYIKIFTYYNGNFTDFSSYSFSNAFTETAAKITTTSYDTAGSCSSNNILKLKCSKSSAPYTVQLYRFGVAYGSPVITTKNVTFNNLPDGAYYATVYGDGATVFGASKTVNILPMPTAPATSNILSTKATLNWTTIPCADYYSVQYRVHDSLTWTTKKTTGNVGSYQLKSLTASTTYDWRVAAVDSANGKSAISVYTDSVVFTTAASLIAGNQSSQSDDLKTAGSGTMQLITMPNPATNSFKIQLGATINGKITAVLIDMNGKTTWSSGATDAFSLNGKQVNASQFMAGTYLLQIINDKGEIIGKTKIVIDK